VETLELSARQARKEMKEMKFRESRNLADYSELEEENVTLQKQLLYLKQAQVWIGSSVHGDVIFVLATKQCTGYIVLEAFESIYIMFVTCVTDSMID